MLTHLFIVFDLVTHPGTDISATVQPIGVKFCTTIEARAIMVAISYEASK